MCSFLVEVTCIVGLNTSIIWLSSLPLGTISSGKPQTLAIHNHVFDISCQFRMTVCDTWEVGEIVPSSHLCPPIKTLRHWRASCLWSELDYHRRSLRTPERDYCLVVLPSNIVMNTSLTDFTFETGLWITWGVTTNTSNQVQNPQSGPSHQASSREAQRVLEKCINIILSPYLPWSLCYLNPWLIQNEFQWNYWFFVKNRSFESSRYSFGKENNI